MHKTTVRRNIQKLKAAGFIERIGSKKAGYWKVL
jgi:predicted HTH transcriptional regulator